MSAYSIYFTPDKDFRLQKRLKFNILDNFSATG